MIRDLNVLINKIIIEQNALKEELEEAKDGRYIIYLQGQLHGLEKVKSMVYYQMVEENKELDIVELTKDIDLTEHITSKKKKE